MIGIFGGAFDPPHNEHIRIASGVKEEFSLEDVVFLPSGRSPHKDLETPFSLRLKMLQEAIGKELFPIDESESLYPDRAYTYKMIPLLQEKYGEIAFIIGGDSLLSFDRWKCPERILASCPILVVPRGDEDLVELQEAADRFSAKWGGDIRIAKRVKGEAVSSTVVRAKISLGVPTPELSEGVAKIIRDEGLYLAHSDMITRVREALPDKRWAHTCGVVVAGLRINERMKLAEEQVFVACLLHDCMKYATVVHDGVPLEVIGTKVLHAFNGAEEARKGYGITDEAIIDAIRYHTTGRMDMTPLDKLVYTADMVEEHRTFSGVEELRQLAYRDLDAAFAECIRRTYERLVALGNPIYYLTVDCYKQYCTGG